MSLWKKRLQKKTAAAGEEPGSRFSGLRQEITVIRQQGEPPVKDPGTFAEYLCDLCSTPHPVSGLRQCVLCGRWACSDCWKDEYYTCKSCAGLIRIHAVMGRE